MKRKLYLYGIPALSAVGTFATAIACRAASSTAETVAYALETGNGIYNTGVQGGVQGATGMIPMYIGAGLLLVILAIAGYVVGRLLHWGKGIVHR